MGAGRRGTGTGWPRRIDLSEAETQEEFLRDWGECRFQDGRELRAKDLRTERNQECETMNRCENVEGVGVPLILARLRMRLKASGSPWR